MTELSQAVAAHLSATLTSIRLWLETPRRDERGSVTLENLLWAILVVALVAIAAAAITAAVNRRAGLLN